MRVLVLTTSFPRYFGDYAGSFILDLCRGLSGRGFKLSAVAPSDKNAKRAEIMEGVNVFRFTYFFSPRFQKLTYGDGMPDNLKKSFLAWLQIPAFLFVFIWRSLRLSSESDIIWSHWLIPSGLVGAFLKKLSGKRHVITVHSDVLPSIKSAFLKKTLLKFILTNTDMIITVSNSLKEKIAALAGQNNAQIKNKIQVIPMGVMHEAYRHSLSKEALRKRYAITTKNVILFIGRLVEVKGLAFLIRALKNFSDYTLVVAGNGYEFSMLKKLAQSFSVNVRWLGFICREKKIDYLALCDLLVMPSVTLSSGVSDSLPVTILEALACAKPVLASRVGGIPEVIIDGYNGFLVEPGNEEQILGRLNELLGKKELLTTLERNAYTSSLRFAMDTVAGEYTRIIHTNYA